MFCLGTDRAIKEHWIMIAQFRTAKDVLDKRNSGNKATKVKYIVPIVVNLTNTNSIYLAVFSPGLIPGIKPPYFLKFSACSSGLKTIDV